VGSVFVIFADHDLVSGGGGISCVACVTPEYPAEGSSFLGIVVPIIASVAFLAPLSDIVSTVGRPEVGPDVSRIGAPLAFNAGLLVFVLLFAIYVLRAAVLSNVILATVVILFTGSIAL